MRPPAPRWTAWPAAAPARCAPSPPREPLHHEVYAGVVSRTNIDIDAELVERAMRLYRLESKRAAVQPAPERPLGAPMTTSPKRDLSGKRVSLRVSLVGRRYIKKKTLQ